MKHSLIGFAVALFVVLMMYGALGHERPSERHPLSCRPEPVGIEASTRFDVSSRQEERESAGEFVRAASAGTTGETWRVRAEDATGRFLESVRIYRRASEEAQVIELGITDAQGIAVLEEPLAPWTVLLACREGFATSKCVLGARPSAETTLVLVRPGTISGRVVLHDGSPAGAVHVVAWPTDSRRTFEASSLDALLDPEVSVTETDALGAFVLEGLDPDRSYQVVAGGRGLIQRRIPPEVEVGNDDVELSVFHAYALILHLVEGEGEAHMSSFAGTGVGFRFRLAEPDAFFPAPGSLAGRLGGAVPEWSELGPAHPFVLVGLCGPLQPAVEVEISARPPGYAPLSVTLDATPLAQGVAEHTVALARVAEAFGSVRIRVLIRERESGLCGPPGYLRFDSVDGAQPRFSCAVDQEVVELPFVPYGEYSVSLIGLPVKGVIAKSTLSVHDPLTEWTLESRDGLAAVEFDVSRPDGRPYTGALDLTLGRLRSPGDSGLLQISRLKFEGPPYRVSCLWPGSFSVREEASGAGVLAHSSFDLKAGEQAEVHLVLAD